MEHSIDLYYLNQICFNDSKILDEMLDEWKIDTSNRIQEYNLNGPECSEKILFQMVHTLKTNFFMIGCVKMIRKCEDFIHSKHNAEIILNFGIDLNLAFEEVCELLEKTNPH